MRFNPPPGWPDPPADWTPPPGWQPEPDWPEPPFGWKLWIDDDAARAPGPDATQAYDGFRLRDDADETAATRPLPAATSVRARTAPPPRPGTAPNTRTLPSARHRPLYRQTSGIVVLLILLFPIGALFLWQRRDWSTGLRTAATVVAGIVFIIAVTSTTAPAHTIPAGSNAAANAASGLPTSQAPGVDTTASSAALSTAPAATSSAPTPAPAPPTTHSAHTTYAAPPPATTPKKTSTPNLCGAPTNPWGYNFCGGGAITDPASAVCGYFKCIASFWDGKGYMVECRDGTYSMSGGRSGACSDHGGESREVYS